MSKVADASTADGSAGWFKVYENGWSAANKRVGDDDNWGVKDMNACCGKVDVKIPSDIQSGDYLVRAEVIALHTAGQSGGAQLYMSCYQVSTAFLWPTVSNWTRLPSQEEEALARPQSSSLVRTSHRTRESRSTSTQPSSNTLYLDLLSWQVALPKSRDRVPLVQRLSFVG